MLGQSSTGVRLRVILPARIKLPLRRNVDGQFIIAFLITLLITFLLTSTFEASTICSISQAFERGQEGERNAAARLLPSRIAHAAKFRTCAEGWIAREWTCWKPRSRTHDRIASN